MVVQHNLTAMNSNRMLGVTTKAQSKTTEKLSSGYKINRAADDAAGLAISEKMRKQIRGLTQASANAQDGISAVQTAEGALTEVQDMLQRMNELAVKASNGTQSESDRASIQAEIDQLATEIDRVAETTKFNETYLLKGDRNVEKGYSYSYKAVKTNKAAGATMDQDKATNLTAKITFNSTPTATAPANAADQNAVAKALRDQGITITAKQNANKDGATYSVTLNGSAANIYKINTISDVGANDGKATKGTGDSKEVDFAVAGKDTAKFEIVDLQGNKIADIEIAGGIGDDVAAESSKVITAKKVEAAENKGDVKQFYDADGNAIAENALGSYFSKLSSAGGETKLYTKDGDVATTAQVESGTLLYTALKGHTTATGVTVNKIPADAAKTSVYTYTGGAWKDNDGNIVEFGAIDVSGSLTEGDKITTTVDTTSVAGKETATATFGTNGATSGTLYKADGTLISTTADLVAALNADTSVTLYTDTELGIGSKKDASDNELDVAIADQAAFTAGKTYKFVANNGPKPAGGGNVGGGAGWYSTDDTTCNTAIASNKITYNSGSATAGDTIEIITVGKTAADKAAAYSYTPGKASLAGEEVAPLAGKQLYDAVGNALDKTNGTINMADAAKEVASNQNLTGALSLNLHVGADATKNNQIDLKIDAMSAKGLGINGIRVDGRTDSNALSAIGTIKEALQKVSSQRSALGAVQNRLEHTINNLDNVVENTTSAESAIRDTDMATTMVQFSNNNILAQAGTSMLAQANQSNQSVLSLLQ